jgi:choline kinase
MHVRTAVFLAAGRGVRMGERGRAMPKGFLRLGTEPIIEESIARLSTAGIERFVIVTGHAAEYYDRLALRHGPAIETVHNPRFADSGSMYSLACAHELIDEDFLLLESDLVFESRAVESVLAAPERDVLLVSGFTQAGDEVFIEVDDDGRLVNMSKDRAQLGPRIAGELVGISKVSRPLLDAMLAVSVPRFDESLFIDYETDALVAAAQEYPVPCLVLQDLVWAEIDDEPAFERAKRSIYPRLAQRD